MTGMDTLLISDAGAARTITLNRPEDLNAINEQVTSDLQEALKAVRKNRVRCLVITGAGRAFCAGQDLKSVQGRSGGFDFAEALRVRYNPVISAIRGLEIPVIASVNGVAAGAGWSLALACDLRISSSTAKFVSAFGKIGLVPDSGMTQTLPRLVGYARALEIAWLGDPIPAKTALEWGLVNKVVEPDALGEATQAWAKALATGPTKGIGLTKRAMASADSRTLDQQLDYEAQLQGIAGQTRDYTEGVKAFIEKRNPEFLGE